jgi:hypothetical protein
VGIDLVLPFKNFQRTPLRQGYEGQEAARVAEGRKAVIGGMESLLTLFAVWKRRFSTTDPTSRGYEGHVARNARIEKEVE